MATRILSRALAALQGIYRFPGQQSGPETMELGLPIQAVHDVAAHAGQARILYNTILEQHTNVPMSTTERTSLSTAEIRAQILANGDNETAQLDDVPTDVWVLAVWAGYLATAPNLARASVGLARGPRPELLFNSDGSSSINFDTAFFSIDNEIQVPTFFPKILRSPGTVGDGTLEFRTSADGAGAATVLYSVFCALAPRGVVPRSL